MQNTFVRAFSKLNKQRIHLSSVAAEGQRREDPAPTNSIYEAQDAVDALQMGLCAFAVMSDEQAAKFQVLHTLLAPLSIQEAPDNVVQAWRDSRLRTTTDAEHSAQTTAINNHTNPSVPVSGLADPPSPSQAVNSDSNNLLLVSDPKPPKEQKTWSPDYAGVEFLTISPTIIKLEDGTFVELRCDLCQGNGSLAHHKFNKGEVEQIKTGDSQIEFIACQTKVNVGSGKEYVGNMTTAGPVTVKRAGHTVETLATAAAAGQTQTATATPAAPKKQRKMNAETASPCLSNCPIVVQTTAEDGTDNYHELRCDVCHGNGSFGSGKLLEGVKGFKAHFRQIHHEQLLTADVRRRCYYREVPLQEAQEIQAGNVNIGFIRCAGSANVRPKTSYKNFNNVERT
ncbi:hypothetical protein Q7P35_005407 [Cladosporium inversicolor]